MSNICRLIEDPSDGRYYAQAEEWRSHSQHRFHSFERRPADYEFLENAHNMDRSERYYHGREHPRFHHPEQHHSDFHHPEHQPRRFHHPEQHHPDFHYPEHQPRGFHHPEQSRPDFHHPEHQPRGFHHPERHHPDFHHDRLIPPHHLPGLHEQYRHLYLERQHALDDLHRLEHRVQTLRMSDQTTNCVQRPENNPPRVLNGQKELLKPHPAAGMVLVRATQIATRQRPQMGQQPAVQQHAPRQLFLPLNRNSLPGSDEAPKNISISSSAIADSKNSPKQRVDSEIDNSIPLSTIQTSSTTLNSVAKSRSLQTLQTPTKQATSKDFLDKVEVSVKPEVQRSSLHTQIVLETKDQKLTKPLSEDIKSPPQVESPVKSCLTETISCLSRAKYATNVKNDKDKDEESMEGNQNQQSQHNKSKQIQENSKSEPESLHQNLKTKAESEGDSRYSSAQEVDVPSVIPMQKISNTLITKQIPISTKSEDVKNVESSVSKTIILDRNFEPIKSVVSSRRSNKGRKTADLQSFGSYEGKDVKDKMLHSMKDNRKSSNIICNTAVDFNKNNNGSTQKKEAQEQGSSSLFPAPKHIQVITSRFSIPSANSKTSQSEGNTNLSITSNICSSNQKTITSVSPETSYSHPLATSPIKPAKKIEEHFGFKTNTSSENVSISAQPSKESCQMKQQQQSVPQPIKPLKDILKDIGLNIKPFESKQEQINGSEYISTNLSSANENEGSSKADEQKRNNPRQISQAPYLNTVKNTQVSTLELKSIIENVQDVKMVDGHKGWKSNMANIDCGTTKGPDSSGETVAIMGIIPINELKTIVKMTKKVEKPKTKGSKEKCFKETATEKTLLRYEEYDARKYSSSAYERDSIGVKLLPQTTVKTIDDLMSASDDEGEKEKNDTDSRRSKSVPKNSLSQYNFSSERSMEDQPKNNSKSPVDGTIITSSYRDYVSLKKRRDEYEYCGHYSTDGISPKTRYLDSAINSDDNMNSRWPTWNKKEFRKEDLDEKWYCRMKDSGQEDAMAKNNSLQDLFERRISKREVSNERIHSKKDSSGKEDSDERRFSRQDDSSDRGHARKDSSERKDSDERRFSRQDDSSGRGHARKDSSERTHSDEKRFSRWDDFSGRSHARKDSSERTHSDEKRFSRWDDSSNRGHARKDSSGKKDSDEERFSRWDDSSNRGHARKDSSERKDSDEERFSRWDDFSGRSHARKDSSGKEDSDERRISRWDDSSWRSHARKDSTERKDSDERRFSRWDDSSDRGHARKDSSERKDSDEERFSRWDDFSGRSHARKDSSERKDSDERRFSRWDESSDRGHARKDSSERKDSDEERFSRWDDFSGRSHARKDSSERKDSDERRISRWDDSSKKSHSRKDSSEKKDSVKRIFSRWDDTRKRSHSRKDSSENKDSNARRFSRWGDYDYRESPRKHDRSNSIDTDYDYRSGQRYDSSLSSTKSYSSTSRNPTKSSSASPIESSSTLSPTKPSSATSSIKSSSAKSPTKTYSARSPTKSSSARRPTNSSSVKSSAKTSSSMSPTKSSLADNLIKSSTSNPKKSSSKSSPTKLNTYSHSKSSSKKSPSKRTFSFSKYSPYKKGLSSRRNLCESKHFDLRLKIPKYGNELDKDYRKHQPHTTNVPLRREIVKDGDIDQYRTDVIDSETLRNTFTVATKHIDFGCRSRCSTSSSVEGEIRDVDYRNKTKRTTENISITSPTVSSTGSYTTDRDYRKSPVIITTTKKTGQYSPIICDQNRDQRSYEPSTPTLNELAMKDVDNRTVSCKSKVNMISPSSSSVPNKIINIPQEPRNPLVPASTRECTIGGTKKVNKTEAFKAIELESYHTFLPTYETEQSIYSKPNSADTSVLFQHKTSDVDETCLTIENSISKISLKNIEDVFVRSVIEPGTMIDLSQNSLQHRADVSRKSQSKISKNSRWDVKAGSMKQTSKKEEMLRKDQLKKAVSAMAADPSIMENLKLVEEASDQSSQERRAQYENIVKEAVTLDPEAHPTKTVVETASYIVCEGHRMKRVVGTALTKGSEEHLDPCATIISLTKRSSEQQNQQSTSSREPEFGDINPSSDTLSLEIEQHLCIDEDSGRPNEATIQPTAECTWPTKASNNSIQTYSSHQGWESSQPCAASCSVDATNDITDPSLLETLCSASDSDNREREKEKHDQKKCSALKVTNNSKQRHSSENSKNKSSSKLSSRGDNQMFSKYKDTEFGVPKSQISSTPSGMANYSSKSFKSKRRHQSTGQLRVQSEKTNVFSIINPIVIDSSSSSETEGKNSVTSQVQSGHKDKMPIYVSSSESDVQSTKSPLKIIKPKKKINSTGGKDKLGNNADRTSSVSVSKFGENITVDKKLVILVKDIYPTKSKDSAISKVLESEAKGLATKPDKPQNQHKLKLKIPKKTGAPQCKEDLSGDNSAFGSFLEQQSHEYFKKRIKSNKSPKRLPVKPLSLPSTPDKNVMEYPSVKPRADRSISCDDSDQFKTPDKPKVSSDSLLLRESILSGFRKNLEKSPILKSKLKSSSPGNQKGQAVHWNSGESSKTVKVGVPAVRSSIEEPKVNDDICHSNSDAVMKSSIEPCELKSAVSMHGKTDEIDDDSGETLLPDDHSNYDDSELLGSPDGSLDLGEDDDVDLETEISLLGYNNEIPSKMSTVSSNEEVTDENMEMSFSFATNSTTKTIPESSVRQLSSKPSNTGFSLDDLLAEKDTEVRNCDLLQMQDELKEDIKKGGFKVLQEEALADSCNDLLPEQERELEKLQVSDSVINELHPGETVFHSEFFLRVFNELLKPSHCGFTPGGSLIDQQLSNVQSDLLTDFLASGILTMCFHRITNPESICRWLFYIMSIHRSSLVVHSCQRLLMDIIQTQVTSDNINITWSPSPLDILKIFINYGAIREDFLPADNCYSSEEISAIIEPTLETGINNNNNNNSLYLISRDNLLNVLDTLSCALQARPNLKTEELTFMVEILVKAAIDKSLNNNKCHYEFQVVVSSVLECYDKDAWLNMVPELCDRLSKISSHHHNRVYVVQLLPPGSRGHYFQQRLAAVLLHEEMTGNLLTQCPEKIQIKSLFIYVDYMKKLIKNVDLYKLCSCIMLMDLAVGNETIATSEKAYLSMLSERINVLKGDLRDSVYMLDKTRVKDLMVRISSKWTLMISTMGSTQRNLFSWTVHKSPHKMRVETLETQSDHETNGSDSETENQSKDNNKVIDTGPKASDNQMESDVQTPSGSNSQTVCRNILESDDDMEIPLLSSDDDLPEL